MDAEKNDTLKDGDRKSSPKTTDNCADIDIMEHSFCSRIRTDKLHRRKWLLTGFVCWSFVVLLSLFLFVSGGTTWVASTWSTEGQPFMQALHFSFALGGIFSPLITEPFLAPKITEALDFHQLNVTGKRTNSFGTTNTIPLTTSYSGVGSSNNFTDKQAHGTPEYRETKVHFAYLLSGLLLLSAALPFLYLTFRKWSIGNERESKDSSSHTNEEGKMSRRMRVTMLILLSLLMLAYCSIEDNFSSFLMTFLISQLNWSKYLGSMATSAYWVAFGTGRFCGIFISRCLSPVKMLGIFYVSFCFSFIGLLVTTILNLNFLVWIFVVISGFSSSVIFPSVYSWTEDKVMHVSGKVTAMFQITASIGSMTTPLLLGYLMENYTPMWYAYLITGLSGVGLMLYLVTALFIMTQVTKTGKQDGNKISRR